MPAPATAIKPRGTSATGCAAPTTRAKDQWQWKVIVSASSNSRYKSGGINFVDGKVYWISDANGPKPHDRGIFRCDPADIANPEKHTLLFNPEVESANMIIQDGVILASHCAPRRPWPPGIIISPDMGKTWAQYDLKEFGKRSPAASTRRTAKAGSGWTCDRDGSSMRRCCSSSRSAAE